VLVRQRDISLLKVRQEKPQAKGDSGMPTKIALGTLAAVLGSALLGWMIISGWLPDKLRAQKQPADKTSGEQELPVADPPFRGVIGHKAKDSKPDFPKAVTAPKDAPNVLLIVTDDTGFGASSTFGGSIPTPAFDRVAQRGLRFNNFHTTGLCSPTRAALLTGRNHQSVGFGNITEFATGYRVTIRSFPRTPLPSETLWWVTVTTRHGSARTT
jgi:hypothetical protein